MSDGWFRISDKRLFSLRSQSGTVSTVTTLVEVNCGSMGGDAVCGGRQERKRQSQCFELLRSLRGSSHDPSAAGKFQALTVPKDDGPRLPSESGLEV